MGNIGSHQTGHISSSLRADSTHHGHHHHHLHPGVIHGPRGPQYNGRESKPPQPQKVLPERDVHQKLRSTGNGEILLAGGTLSGRQQWQNPESGSSNGSGVYRSSSIPCGRAPGRQGSGQGSGPRPQSPQPTTRPRYNQTSTQIDHLHHHRYASKQAQQLRQMQMRRSGSEPDLRGPEYFDQTAEHLKAGIRAKKKYKAPAPPSNNTSDKPSTDEDHGSVDTESPARKARLFKTHAETKKKSSSPIANRNIIGRVPEGSSNLIDTTRHKSNENLSQLPPAMIDQIRPTTAGAQRLRSHLPIVMQRTKSSPDFRSELKEATRRLSESANKKIATPKVDVPSEPNIAKLETASKLKTLDHNLYRKEMFRSKLKELREKEMSLIMDVRAPASGKESTPEQSPPKVKTFYFGMERMIEDQDVGNSLESEEISSESEEETSNHDGIALQLRPILPKKQLEIPSFSPAAAWRLLSSMDVDPRTGSAAASEDGPVFYEDKIENLSRPPPPYPLQHIPQGPRSNNDKSGDSGISGDETPDAALMNPRYRGNSWTPQQDLGDDSSLEEGIDKIDANVVSPTKFASKPHVFSLSLPRENHLSTYIAERTSLQPFTSLQKLKKSVTGVLGHMSATGANKRDSIPEQIDLIDPSDNWFLSRSAPNSLNNGFNSLELRRSKVLDIDLDAIPRAPQNPRRIMYLPQSPNTNVSSHIDPNHKRKYMSKSYENLSTDLGHPQDLQDPPRMGNNDKSKDQPRKPKKFTFQSTVRQIERRRLAEKLSKEVERKEQQRLRELEAMQRVEEEFQKKRAREKATIRQQLRLYTMDDTSWSSLPPNIDLSEEVREEPDGAVSSNAASPTLAKMASENANVDFRGNAKAAAAATTQILSEYRQPQREYREYRTSSGQNGRHILVEQATTVHPKITCNMPKAMASNYTDNYRKDFAHGVKASENEPSNARNHH